MIKLYSAWRSSAAYRVRIALALKGVPYEYVPVNLVKGENRGAAYLALNPQGRVPLLVDGEFRLAQSMAMLDYLEALHPRPALLPDALAHPISHLHRAGCTARRGSGCGLAGRRGFALAGRGSC